MKYTFEDCVKRSNSSVELLCHVNKRWIFFIAALISLLKVLVVNLFLFAFLRERYFDYFFADKTYSILSFNLVIFLLNLLISIVYVIEAKLHRKYRLFYYIDEKEVYRNLFSNEVVVFSTFVVLFLISLVSFDNFKSILTSSEEFFNFASMYFFMLFPIMFIAIFYLYRYIMKYILVYFIDGLFPLMYPNNRNIDNLIEECRSSNKELTFVIMSFENFKNMKYKKELLKAIKEKIVKKTGKNLNFININRNYGILGFSDSISYDSALTLVEEKILPTFKSPVEIKKRKISLNIKTEIIDIRQERNIKNAFDLIGQYIK